jgi:hypothetical protein
VNSPKQFQSLGTTHLAPRAQLRHRIEGRSPKLMSRMPPCAQRRNTAYLNRPDSLCGQLDRELDDQAPRASPDLRLISGARSSSASDLMTFALPTWTDRLFARAA